MMMTMNLMPLMRKRMANHPSSLDVPLELVPCLRELLLLEANL
nr:hypothetical protein [Tanacetum cinerariifolium]